MMKPARFALLAALVAVGVLMIGGVALAANIKGTPKADNLYGTEQADNINPFNGDDYVDAKGGDDYVHHSYGNDIIYGGSDDDTLRGGFGNDEIWGGPGRDLIDCAYLEERGDGANPEDYDIAHAKFGEDTVVDCEVTHYDDNSDDDNI